MQKHYWYLTSLKANDKTKLFHSLDILFNKSFKCYFSSKYKGLYVDKVLEQFDRGVSVHDVKVDIRSSTINPLHTKWILDMFKFMMEPKDLIISSSRNAHISEAAAESANFSNVCENPFQQIELVDTASWI